MFDIYADLGLSEDELKEAGTLPPGSYDVLITKAERVTQVWSKEFNSKVPLIDSEHGTGLIVDFSFLEQNSGTFINARADVRPKRKEWPDKKTGVLKNRPNPYYMQGAAILAQISTATGINAMQNPEALKGYSVNIDIIDDTDMKGGKINRLAAGFSPVTTIFIRPAKGDVDDVSGIPAAPEPTQRRAAPQRAAPSLAQELNDAIPF